MPVFIGSNTKAARTTILLSKIMKSGAEEDLHMNIKPLHHQSNRHVLKAQWENERAIGSLRTH